MAPATPDRVERFSGFELINKSSHFRKEFEAISQTAQTEHSECVHFVKRRSTPDVIIMGHCDEIIFVSTTENSPAASLNSDRAASKESPQLDQLRSLLSGLRQAVLSRARLPVIERSLEPPTALFTLDGATLSLRGLLLNSIGGASPLVMVLIEKVNSSHRGSSPPVPLPHFTPREKSVLSYIKKGYTNKEIACALDIGVHTVKDHLKRIMGKVGVHTRAGIVGKLNVQ